MAKTKATLAGQPKMAALLKLMRRAGGATEAQMAKANAWLGHTTRAAICRLRQAGIAIETNRASGEETLYRIGGKAKLRPPESWPRKAQQGRKGSAK